MNKPEILGAEVMTPDGQGHILSLHNRSVIVRLNSVGPNQTMIGGVRQAPLNYAYPYSAVQVIKGQYEFKEDKRHLYSREKVIEDWLKTPEVIGIDSIIRAKYDQLNRCGFLE